MAVHPIRQGANGDAPKMPLTPAEKQRAYRERKGDAYRKANAARMRAKRQQ